MSNPQAYNVVWHAPSHDAQGSVPLGNGEIGLNAWISKQGALCFYIGRTDSWGDNGRLLKLGRVRVVLDPAPNPSVMQQTLDLPTGTWQVQFGPCADHRLDTRVDIRLWVDAHQPVVHVNIDATTPIAATAHIELWRTEREELEELQVSDIMLDRSRPDQKHAATIIEPDTVLQDRPDWIGWYHHNTKSVGPALTAELQGLEGFDRGDPLLDRIFGAAILTRDGTRVHDRELRSEAGTSGGVPDPRSRPASCLACHLACGHGRPDRHCTPGRSRLAQGRACALVAGILGPELDRDFGPGGKHSPRSRTGQPFLCPATVCPGLCRPGALPDQVQRIHFQCAVSGQAGGCRLPALGTGLLVAEHTLAVLQHVCGRGL